MFGDEADLLAVVLVRDLQAALARERPHVVLGHLRQREDGARQLRLRQAEQEVRLVFPRIAAPQQAPPAGRAGSVPHARVVPGRDRRRAPAPRARSTRFRELQLRVAVRAGQGRAPGEILADEVGDHGLVEAALEVHDVVRDAEGGGDAPGVVQVVDRAAGAERDLAAALVVQLHRQAHHLVARLPQEQRRDGGVHAAGHGNDDAG